MTKAGRQKGVTTFLRGGIYYRVKLSKKRGCYSPGALRRMGAEVFGRDVYVSRASIVACGVQLYSPCHISGESVICAGAKLLSGCTVADSYIGENCVVEASKVASSRIGRGCTVGPYADIRPGCTVGDDCRIGNFVELKNAVLGAGCKAAHLAYIGDARLGARVNVGCGVVFANYDGRQKARTYVEDNAFIGSNSVVVAPAHIGAGAYVAAGTVLSGDVPQKSLALSRPPLKIKPEGACGRYLNDR